MTNRNTLPLSDLHSGETARVSAPTAASGYESRLASMGLLPGASLEVLQAGMGRALIVRVGGTRLMLARELADAVSVVRLPPRRPAPRTTAQPAPCPASLESA